jgi:hypothetical protein
MTYANRHLKWFFITERLRFRHLGHHFLTPGDCADISISKQLHFEHSAVAECSIKGCIKHHKWMKCKGHCSAHHPDYCTVCTLLYSNLLWLLTKWWSDKLEWWGQHKLLWLLLEQTKLRELYSLRNHSPRFTISGRNFPYLLFLQAWNDSAQHRDYNTYFYNFLWPMSLVIVYAPFLRLSSSQQ